MPVGERSESSPKQGQGEEENPVTGGIFLDSGLFSGKGRSRYTNKLFLRSRSPGRRHRRRYRPPFTRRRLLELIVVDF